MWKRVVWGIVVGMLLFAFGARAADDKAAKEEAALGAAKSWLSKVDDGRYRESWKDCSDFFRSSVSQGQWDDALKNTRKPLGKALSRRLMGKSFTTSLPGAPDGEYVVIQFDTSFENKKSATETVTPMKDADGVWRISGYYIR